MDIKDLLLTTKRIALVGASDRPDRPSYGVMKFLLDRGYDVTPVNPTLVGKEIHGRKVVGQLAEAGPLDLVDVFRRSEDAGGRDGRGRRARRQGRLAAARRGERTGRRTGAREGCGGGDGPVPGHRMEPARPAGAYLIKWIKDYSLHTS
jgi:hypothetical protein